MKSSSRYIVEILDEPDITKRRQLLAAVPEHLRELVRKTVEIQFRLRKVKAAALGKPDPTSEA